MLAGEVRKQVLAALTRPEVGGGFVRRLCVALLARPLHPPHLQHIGIGPTPGPGEGQAGRPVSWPEASVTYVIHERGPENHRDERGEAAHHAVVGRAAHHHPVGPRLAAARPSSYVGLRACSSLTPSLGCSLGLPLASNYVPFFSLSFGASGL